MTVSRERYYMFLRKLECFAFRIVCFFRNYIPAKQKEKLFSLQRNPDLTKNNIYVAFCEQFPELESNLVATTNAYIEFLDIENLVVRNEKRHAVHDCFHHMFLAIIESLLTFPVVLDLSHVTWGQGFTNFRGIFERIVSESIVMRQME